jgi:GWxTD domain-containing protein
MPFALRPFLALALVVAAPRPLPAQAPDATARLLALRAALARETDTTALVRRERQWIEVARQRRDSALLHLELGLVALRLGELSGRSHFDDAASEFEWAAELEPSWPFPWVGLALAEEGYGDSPISPAAGLQAMLGRDRLSRAVGALQRALAVEPAYPLALVEFARIAEAQRIRVRLDDALAAFRLAGSANLDDAAVQLARGRVERLAGDPDTALAAFRRYAALGGTRGLAQLEIARTLFVLDSLAGAAAYFEGASDDTPEVVRLYRGDLLPIAADSELARFDARWGRGRADVLRAFWFRRDRADLRQDGERLREHYRRLHHARREYRLSGVRRRYDTDERYRSGSADLDDRGIVFVRHGAPDTAVRYVAVGACANETWRYRRPDGDLLLHFVARDDVGDFRLVESVLDIMDAGGITRLRQESCDGGNVGELVLSRVGLSPLYDRLLNASANNYLQLANEDRVQGQASIRTGTTTDAYALRFEEPLAATADGIVVGRERGRPLLHVSFAVRGESARSRSTAFGEAYPVRLRLVATGHDGELLASLDTARLHVSERKLAGDEYLMGRIAVPVPPGVVSYRVAVSQGEERGVLLPTDSVLAPRLEGELALSDIALGGPGVGARWVTPAGELVHMNPLGAYREGALLELYAEVYGAAAGAPLTVELDVTGSGRRGFLGLFGGRRGITVRGQEQSRGPGSTIRRTVSLEGLPPGDYRLALRVRDATGAETERRRVIRVLPRASS